MSGLTEAFENNEINGVEETIDLRKLNLQKDEWGGVVVFYIEKRRHVDIQDLNIEKQSGKNLNVWLCSGCGCGDCVKTVCGCEGKVSGAY